MRDLKRVTWQAMVGGDACQYIESPIYWFGVRYVTFLPRGHSFENTRRANILLFSLLLPLPCPLFVFALSNFYGVFSALTFTGVNMFVIRYVFSWFKENWLFIKSA